MFGLLTIMGIHVLAVMSPGPDLAYVIKESLTHGRGAGFFAAVGLGAGILLHCAYSILGLGLIISQSIVLFSILKYMSAAYLIYIGIKGLLTKRVTPTTHSDVHKSLQKGDKRSIVQQISGGFFCNALNPKATVFFLMVFSQIINPTTPLWVQAGYAIIMGIQTMLWFSVISFIISHGSVRGFLQHSMHWVERTMGAVLIALGLKVASSSQ